jgi:LysR family transcriptional activator of nhaA
MATLNYHHLRYFWAVAHEGSLAAAAQRLNLSQSALSVQLRKLEDRLGHDLFERRGRSLLLTEAGRMALDYADTIFEAGDELLETLRGSGSPERRVLRVGAITTLSRNFQLEFLRPLVDRRDVELVVRSGDLRTLLPQLEVHALDLVLANQPVPRDAATTWYSQLIDEQPVSLVGPAAAAPDGLRFPDDLARIPVLLPSLDSDLRVAFDRIMELAGIRPLVQAEVDDMAMLRLLTRESSVLALVPPVVVQDELHSGLLVEHCRIPELAERFYAIFPSRRFPNPLVRELMGPASGS